MPSPVPALDRAVTILDHLAAHPRDRFTLSDLARSCGISKATTASVLAALVSHGVVRRDNSLRYCLGDRLIQLGEARRSHFRAFDAAREEMTRLAGRTGLSVAAIAREGDDLVILDMLGDSRPAHLQMRIGMRVPLRPPIGAIFKAWAPPAEVDHWITAMVNEFGGERDRHVAAVAALRSRRYSLGGEHDLDVELESALARISRQDGDARALEVALVVARKIRNFHSDTGDRADELVNSVIGPVFDNDGMVVMSLNAYGPLGTLRRSDLAEVVPILLDATVAVTARIGGRLPEGWHAGTNKIYL